MHARTHRGVLFMSDDAALRRLVVRALADAYDAVAVSTADDALRLVRDGWRFVAIVCDVSVPDLSGPAELMIELARLDPAYPRRVVFLTGADLAISALRERIERIARDGATPVTIAAPPMGCTLSVE